MTLRDFRYVALAEATSFLALLVTSAIKNTGGSEIGVQILGPIHGVLFLVYVALVLFEVRTKVGGHGRTTLLVLAESVIPAGGFLAARRPELATSHAAARSPR